MTTIEVWYAITLFVMASGGYLTRLSPRRRLHHLGVGLLMASIYALVNTPFPASNRIFFACWLGGLLFSFAIIAHQYWRRRRRALIG